MYARKKYRCDHIRKNNGIIDALFKRDEDGQEEIVQINILAGPDRFVEGSYYWVQIEGAFPQR